ncbi:hypothetical protein Tsubulata_004631 [Turnera subulata]|uniref:Pectinesterase inhibitor domain-containing protein n=1 Tax=Turnera subulata TaxID=218843 RepID=A0A9Q0GDW3_9ROSI|nr:hypothetical protein Tsubulata_004631 [Turnera subulata]
MGNNSFFSSPLFCFLYYFLLVPNHKVYSTNTFSNNLINQTCKECADEYTVGYAYCSSSLGAVPVSHMTNLQGLALISMELALENATYTSSSIKNLLADGSFDSFSLDCLQDCLELYSDAVLTLIDGVAAFLKGRYDFAEVMVGAVMDASTKCEEGFMVKGGEVSPLTRENYDLFALCDIALCIINILGLSVPHYSYALF